MSHMIEGQRFGRLVALSKANSYVAPNGRKSAKWLCKCDCGEFVEILATSLVRGHTRSCGCLARDVSFLSATKHGREGTRLYDVWTNMKQRCGNPQNPRFSDYGGRGITVCEEWLDFSNFASWADSSGYDETAGRGLCTLDRIDNDRGYSPDNCRWVDMHEQRMNQRRMKNGV